MEKNRVIGGRTRYCLWCGMPFTGTMYHAIFCSKTCYDEMKEKHPSMLEQEEKPGKLLEPEIRICKRCGKPFVTRHEGKRYCGIKCRFHPQYVEEVKENVQ